MRTGTRALSLLAVPLNVLVLKALEDGERSLADLSRAVGHPPETTLRSYLRTLIELELLDRKQQPGFPGAVSHALTPTGERLSAVGVVVEDWLMAAPDGSAPLGGPVAKSALKALANGWDIGIVRALAAHPFTLTELDQLITKINYPTLERRLTAMRLAGQVEAYSDPTGRGTPYKATRWLRVAAASLAAAMAWDLECHLPEAKPLRRLEAESIFLLAVPAIEASPVLSGVCRLAMELRNGADLDYVGVTVDLDRGKLKACAARVNGDVDAWATGSPLDWFRWINSEGACRLDFGGDTALAGGLAEDLRAAFALKSVGAL